jgi:hypothetical protein
MNKNMDSITSSLNLWQVMQFYVTPCIVVLVGLALYFITQRKIDKYQELSDRNSEAITLIKQLKESPNRYASIYDRLNVLNPTSDIFPQFRELIAFTDELSKSNFTDIGTPIYQDAKNRTLPLLLHHFPKQVFEDITLDIEFKKRSALEGVQNSEAKRIIEELNNVTNASPIKSHQYAIKRTLIDICSHSPRLLPYLLNTFGQAKVDEIRTLWLDDEIALLDPRDRQLLITNGLCR